MTERSAAELEQEAEAARHRMTETAESLQRKMTPGQVLDDLGSYFKNSDGSIAFENLKTQVRDNPLPLALVGTGLAWLFMGGGPSSGRLAGMADGHPDHPGGDHGTASDEVWKGAPGLKEAYGSVPEDGSTLADKAGGLRKSASAAAGSVSDTIGSAYASAGRAAGSAAQGAHWARQKTGEAGHYASSHARHTGSRAHRMFTDTLDQEPLILGAIGVAVGAAIGAMLPRTRFEEEYVAPYGEKVREGVNEAVQHGVDRAKDVASEAYRAGKDEAERQNLSSRDDADTLKDKATKIAGSASETAKTSTRAKLDDAKHKDTK